jgi:AmmeMemoRadiSam system protein B
MLQTRRPAVAGSFYSAEPQVLASGIRKLLAEADAEAREARTPGPAPKALIVPHAGYRYSGPVAASAYRLIEPHRDKIRKVVLLGPSHRVPVRGLGTTSAHAFATPLGEIPIDRGGVEAALALAQVHIDDAAHEAEHSLEVQLPFLQCCLERFELIPFSVGDATTEEVGEVLETLWGGDETLIVISSDLSHFLSYEEARAADEETTRAIEELRPEALDYESACGRVPARGLLWLAARRDLVPRTLDVRNSGDTQGGRERVVGYGSWAFWPSDSASGVR